MFKNEHKSYGIVYLKYIKKPLCQKQIKPVQKNHIIPVTIQNDTNCYWDNNFEFIDKFINTTKNIK